MVILKKGGCFGENKMKQPFPEMNMEPRNHQIEKETHLPDLLELSK